MAFAWQYISVSHSQIQDLFEAHFWDITNHLTLHRMLVTTFSFVRRKICYTLQSPNVCYMFTLCKYINTLNFSVCTTTSSITAVTACFNYKYSYLDTCFRHGKINCVFIFVTEHNRMWLCMFRSTSSNMHNFVTAQILWSLF